MGAAIADSIDPFVRGLSGRPEAVGKFLDDLGIDPGGRRSSLTSEETRRLVDALRGDSRGNGAWRPRRSRSSTRSDGSSRPLGPRRGGGLEPPERRGTRADDARGRGRLRPRRPDRGRAGPARGGAAGANGVLRGLCRLEDEGVNSMSSLAVVREPGHDARGHSGRDGDPLPPRPRTPRVRLLERLRTDQGERARDPSELIDRGARPHRGLPRAPRRGRRRRRRPPHRERGDDPRGHARDRFLAEADRVVGEQIAARAEAS